MTEIEAAVEALAYYYKNQPTAVPEMLGIHLEGPFISQLKKRGTIRSIYFKTKCATI
ncbi:hypothetical protein OL548_10400 [Lysinibacillus sp. MHQ-1]|nr:hypothetical protein OL548_10400 [Lysinibacillus sp. MHQ-1]